MNFLDCMHQEVQSNISGQVEDKYSDVMQKLEQIKTKSNKSEANDGVQDTNEAPQDDEDIDDNLEARLMDDITQSMKAEANEESKSGISQSGFQKEYEKCIQEFSYAINSKNRKTITLTKISEVTSKVSDLIDGWRDQDPNETSKCYKETLLKGKLNF